MTYFFLSDIINIKETLQQYESPFNGRKRWNMDIASLSVALSNSSSLNQIGTAVLSKALDTNDTIGQGLVEMIDAAAMERSVNPHIGSNFDMLV